MAKMAKCRRHNLEFKRQAVERMKTCDNVGALARELKIQRKLLYTWKNQFEGRPEPRHANLAKTTEERKDKQLRDELTTLRAALAKKTVENDFSSLPCSKSGRDASRAKKLAGWRLRGHPIVDARARHVECGTDVLFSLRHPSWLLPRTGGKKAGRGRDERARSHTRNRACAPSPLRLPAGHKGSAPAG